MSARRGLALLALACGCATLRPPAPPARELPRVFCGRYYWTTDERCPSAVRLTVTTRKTSGKRIAFAGSHVYEGPEGRFVMHVRGEIDGATRRVVLHESEPSPRENAVVAGAFEGRVTPDLETIAAIWTTRPSGEVGILVLHAEGTAGADCDAVPER